MSTCYETTDSLGQAMLGHAELGDRRRAARLATTFDQILHCRDEVPEGETLTEHRNRGSRESLLWVKGTEHLPGDAQLIDVADQGASTFEFFEHESKGGRRFIVRNGKVRKVYGGHEPVHDQKDAWRVVSWYERRWVIEEYHKAMKTGCRIEDLQFTAVERLQPAIAMLSGVALTLLNLRDASRRPDASTRRAATLFAAEYVEVLSTWRYGKLHRDLTVHDFFFALARLGGHLTAKRNKCGQT